jgi:hypothetical protein
MFENGPSSIGQFAEEQARLGERERALIDARSNERCFKSSISLKHTRSRYRDALPSKLAII